jgi:DNA gyrase subunit A
VRRNGLRAITLDDGEELAWAEVAEGNEDIMLVTHQGYSIRFPQEQVRPMGREASGVKGIALHKNDSVIRMDLVNDKATHIVLVAENGYGKRSPLREYKIQRRGGQGTTAIKLSDKTGNIVGARVVGQDDAELILMSAEGLVTRTDVKSIRQTARSTQGVIVMRLNKGDVLTSMATLNKAEV